VYIDLCKGEIGNPLRPLAGGVPVKRNGFAGFIKCLAKWLPGFTGSLFFFADGRGMATIKKLFNLRKKIIFATWTND